MNDPIYGERLLQVARNAVLKKLNLTCPRVFIDFDDGAHYFDWVGISSFFGNFPLDLDETKIAYLKKDLNATHMMNIRPLPESSRLKIFLYKITKKNELNRIVDFDTMVPEEVEERRIGFMLKSFARMMPNSLTLGLTRTEVAFREKNDYEEGDTDSVGVIPPILSSLSFNKIDHPSSFALIDVHGSLFPGFYAFAINQRTTMVRDAGLPSEDKAILRINSYGICINANGVVSLHTPIGTTYFSGGYGPCFMRIETKDRRPIWTGDGAIRLGMGHRVFLSRELFIFLDADFLSFHNKIYSSDYADSRQISRASLGIGAYIPDVERVFIKDWQRLF